MLEGEGIPMHNLHLLVVSATNIGEAIQDADLLTNDWGNENNWRTFLSAFSEDGLEQKILDTKDWDLNSLHDVYRMAQGWVQSDEEYENKNINLMTKAINKEITDWLDWYKIQKYAEFKHYSSHITIPDSYNLFQTEFYPYQLDTNGVTHLTVPTEGSKKYVIVVDMHS
jgi:hypothetical protein